MQNAWINIKVASYFPWLPWLNAQAVHLTTSSKKNFKSSGSTNGVIPCPRFTIHLSLPPPNPFTMSSTTLVIASRPPYKTPGSAFPCNVTLPLATLTASAGSCSQSSPTTSYPDSHSLSSAYHAPFANTVIGTTSTCSSLSLFGSSLEICRRYGSAKSVKLEGESSPAQLSKTMTSCAPATTWRARYSTQSSAMIWSSFLHSSGYRYSHVLAWRKILDP